MKVQALCPRVTGMGAQGRLPENPRGSAGRGRKAPAAPQPPIALWHPERVRVPAWGGLHSSPSLCLLEGDWPFPGRHPPPPQGPLSSVLPLIIAHLGSASGISLGQCNHGALRGLRARGTPKGPSAVPSRPYWAFCCQGRTLCLQTLLTPGPVSGHLLPKGSVPAWLGHLLCVQV